MAELIAITYEESRRIYFEEQLRKAQNKVKYWAARVDRARPHNLRDEAHIKASEAGWEASFYRDALEALAATPKWISVSERLPQAFCSVLVYIPEEAPMPTVHEGYMADNGRWISTVYVREFEKVTHWMHLPEPPEEDTRCTINTWPD